VTALIAAVALDGATSFAGAQTSALSREIDGLVGDYVAAWYTHDPGALGDFFAADADMIMGNGPILSGRPAIEAAWRGYFAAQEPERTLTIEILGTGAIAPDVVLLNVRTTTGGRWLITAMRGMPTEQDRILRSREQPDG
jgi:ketosteroid isomerase-like protein